MASHSPALPAVAPHHAATTNLPAFFLLLYQPVRFPADVTPDAAIERLYDLHPGITVGTTRRGGPTSPHERPHKPLLLLAALDLIDEGLAAPARIPWCQELRDRFSALPAKRPCLKFFQMLKLIPAP